MKKAIRIILVVLAAILLVLTGKICFNYIYNSTENFLYHLGSTDLNPKPLLFANFHEPYVAWYNDGCIDFKQGRYENAQEEFEKALSFELPEKRECDIRVNLVLSILSQYDWSGTHTVDGEKLLADLRKCRDILLEDGCATDTNDGHDVEAQRLKNEIDDLIEMLEEQQQQQSSDGDDSQDNQSQNPNDSNNQNQNEDNENQSGRGDENHEETPEEKAEREKEESIRQSLEDQRKDSQQEREDEMRREEERSGEMIFDFYDTIW